MHIYLLSGCIFYRNGVIKILRFIDFSSFCAWLFVVVVVVVVTVIIVCFAY